MAEPARNPGVIFYDLDNYESSTGKAPIYMGQGRYANPMANRHPHKDISSLQIADGTKVTLYMYVNFTGPSLTLTGPLNVPELSAYTIGTTANTWDDQIASFVIEPNTTLPPATTTSNPGVMDSLASAADGAYTYVTSNIWITLLFFAFIAAVIYLIYSPSKPKYGPIAYTP